MTNMTHQGSLYRGNPKFKQGVWNDWAYCDWGTEHGTCPVQIQFFVDLSHLVTPIEINDVQVPCAGQYAIVHMMEKPLDDSSKAHKVSQLFFRATKMLHANTVTPVLSLINIDSIVAPCIGILNDLNEARGPNTYLFLKPRKDWPEILDSIALEEMRSITQRNR
jgi:hypothetical protein